MSTPPPTPELDRRSFLMGAAASAAAFSVAGSASACRSSSAGLQDGQSLHVLPSLPYAPDALEPVIGTRIMELHHGMHHAGYVRKLNAALEAHPALFAKSPEDLLRELDAVPEDIHTAVRNSGGGHVNHTMFWEIMGPEGGGAPTGELGEAIDSAFGSFGAFKEAFNKAGGGQFGSGWVWLTLDGDGRLAVESTPNQDTPLSQGREVVMGNDVWEHAYYLTYENRRGEYLNSWWNVVNWDAVSQRLARAQGRG